MCNSWIWNDNNTPKLGGFGKTIEMGKSFFAAVPKFSEDTDLGQHVKTINRVFELAQCNSLDCMLKHMPSNLSWKTLIPITNQHCLLGELSSDGLMAYDNSG